MQGEQIFFFRCVFFAYFGQVYGGAPPHDFGFAARAFRLAFKAAPAHLDVLKNVRRLPRVFEFGTGTGKVWCVSARSIGGVIDFFQGVYERLVRRLIALVQAQHCLRKILFQDVCAGRNIVG